MDKKLERLLEILWAIFNPYFWISNRESCKEIDAYVNKIIEELRNDILEPLHG